MPRGRGNIKARLQAKLNNTLEDKFKSIYGNILMNSKAPGALVQEIRDITNETDANLIKKVNPVLLKFVALGYLDLLRDNKQFVNKEDIKALLTHRANEWQNSGDYLIQSSNLIDSLRSDAIELNLPSHNRKACEDLLITIDSFFTPQISLGGRCDEIVYLVGKQLSKAASIQYKKLEWDIIENEPVTLGRIFVNAYVVSAEKGNVKYLDKIIQLFGINLETLTIQYRGSTFSPMTFLVTQEPAMKAKYMDLLCNKHGLHPDYDVKRADFENLQKITPLMLAGYREDSDAIKLLLKHGADINLVTSLTGKGGVTLYRTAFSVSIGAKNIDIINLLIDNGADPSKASNLFRKALEVGHGELPPNLVLMPVISQGGNLNSPANYEYLAKVRAIVERHHVKKILSLLEDEAEAVERKEIPDASASKPKSTAEELLDDYIEFKHESIAQEKSCTQDAKVTIESQFDLMLLKFCRNRSEEGAEEIHQYIQENPELNLYALTSILNISEPEEVAHQVFASKPKLLHKFFTLKKAITASDPQDVAANILEHMYPVHSNLKNNVYIAVSPELKCEEIYSTITKKVSSILESCKFIKSDSRKISGLKTYGGMIKLKIGGEDLSLYTNQKYLETTTGNVYIVLDRIGDHKLKKTAGYLETIEVESFAAIWHGINHEALEPEHEDGGEFFAADFYEAKDAELAGDFDDAGY
ncbi:ankyrin repeat domain-containing protein [Rickettsiaceae bacterium]|nr:ankyrin repeat domain-containing protein [Rickettsiaceae bacterium]